MERRKYRYQLTPITGRNVRNARIVAAVYRPPLKLASTIHKTTRAIMAAKMPFMRVNACNRVAVPEIRPPDTTVHGDSVKIRGEELYSMCLF